MPPKKKTAAQSKAKGKKATQEKEIVQEISQKVEHKQQDQEQQQQKPDLKQEEPLIQKKVKKSSEDEQKTDNDSQKIEYVILDIEGTTTPITFVLDILFPFARKQMRSFIIENFSDVEIQKNLREIMTEAKLQKNIDISEFPASRFALYKQSCDFLPKILEFINFLMDENQKLTPLKVLQGKIWKSAYEKKEIQGDVYEDAFKNIQNWVKQGKKVIIYSSGSVEAQKLLFQYSNKGDMLPLLTDHFDTKIGLKTEKKSYENILENLKIQPQNSIFVTDRLQEAEAAIQAGIKSIISVREGTEKLSDEIQFQKVTTFDQILI